MANFFNCGYARGVIKEATAIHSGGDVSKNPQKIKDFYDSKFPDSSFNVTMRDFRPNQTQLIKRIARWKDDSKEPYFKTFNSILPTRV